ncbi:molybdopterin-binding protein [Paenibacillus cymbidii]|uniref:hypothetical protein n=1 Tax=Paenibacillus cymbidii TaxID=1639034 RepID=UPI001F480F6B|nr:hypothetical protein [Paenibacillus cymbidii]
MEIEISEGGTTVRWPVSQMAALGPLQLDIGDRVPGVVGKAFDVTSWYGAWITTTGQTETGEPPTHLQVEASDEFCATIPWEELGQAAFLYEEDGKPIQKGFPLRLYVPNGSSACLNVKSVLKVRLLHDLSLGDEATYGYKNRLSPDDLRKG